MHINSAIPEVGRLWGPIIEIICGGGINAQGEGEAVREEREKMLPLLASLSASDLPAAANILTCRQ